MADAPAPTSKGFDLAQKIGPLPLWAWLGAGIAIWWYLQRKQAASASAPNQQTDPAGNVGSIDPATGYVYSSPEDTAALAANNGGTSSTGTSAGTNATTGAQTYADNNSWGIAATNYLVALGVDATTANAAISNYLASQALTTAQQADVNLAIQKLGAPPSLPSPATSSPVTTPPGGGTTTTPPPSGGGVLPMGNPPPGDAWSIEIPDGSGGWMRALFPTGQSVVTFYTELGVNNGSYPGGLTRTQITNALSNAGGSLA